MIGAVTMLVVFGVTILNIESSRETLGTIVASEEYALPDEVALLYVSTVISSAGVFSICMIMIVMRLVRGKVDDRKFILFAACIPLFILSVFNQPMSGIKMFTHNCTKNSQGHYVLSFANEEHSLNTTIAKHDNALSYFKERSSEQYRQEKSTVQSNKSRFLAVENAVQYSSTAPPNEFHFFPGKNSVLNTSLSPCRSCPVFWKNTVPSNEISTVPSNEFRFPTEQNEVPNTYLDSRAVSSNKLRYIGGQNAVSKTSPDLCLGCPVLYQPWCASTSYIPVVQLVLLYFLAMTPEVISLAMGQAIYAKILGGSH